MRLAGWMYLTASLALLSAADDDASTGEAGSSAEDDPDGFADLDLDMEGEDDAATPLPGAGAAQEAVEDFDLGMPEEDRKTRMKACLFHTTNRVQLRKDMLEQTVKDMVQAHNMKQEQAINALLVTWQMSCYMNIRSAEVGQARRGGPMTEEMEQELFSQRSDGLQNVQQASQRQWKLLESVLAEMHKEQGSAGAGPQPDARSTAGAAGAASTGASRAPPGQSQWLYVFLIFGVFFGVGTLVITKLGRKEKEPERERSAKSQRKAEKAEKKLARKRIS